MAQAEHGDGVQTYLTVSVRKENESAVVEVGGELDLGSAGQLEQALSHAWADSPKVLVVDLADLFFADMAGLRVLLDAQQHADRQNSRLILARVREPIRRVLQLARVTDHFTIRENGR